MGTSRSRRSTAIAATSLATLALLAPSAVAEETKPAEDIAAQVERVAPDEGGYAVPNVRPAGFLAAPADLEVTIPENGDGSVALSSSAVVDLQVALPAEIDLESAVLTTDGSVVYEGDRSSVVVQALESGDVRLQTVSSDPGGPDHFTYAFSSHIRLELNLDGGVDITEVTDGGSIVTFGSIAAPWAYDANGVAVATRYEVLGNVLTQVITPDAGTVYPVVADPKLTFGTRIYWALSRTEQRYFTTMGAAAAAAYLCGQTAGLACPAATAAAVGIGLFLSDRGGLCPTAAPWLQVGFPYAYPLNRYPGPSMACRASV